MAHLRENQAAFELGIFRSGALLWPLAIAIASVLVGCAQGGGLGGRRSAAADFTDCDAGPLDPKKETACAAFTIDGGKGVVVTPAQPFRVEGRNLLDSLVATSMGLGQAELLPVAVRVLDSTAAEITLDESTAFGPVAVSFAQKGVAHRLVLFSNGGKTAYPVIMADPSLVCSKTEFYDANGDLRKGEMGCESTIPPCQADGATSCLANENFPAADLRQAVATNIVEGVTLAGVTGAAVVSPVACEADGAIGCVASSDFAAAATAGLADKVLSGHTVAGIAGNVTLPPVRQVLAATSYGVAGSGSTGELTLPLAENVLSGSGDFGDPSSPLTPTLTLPPASDVYAGVQYGVGGASLTGTLTLAAAANVRVQQGAFGRGGDSVTPALTDCAADGATSCVAVAGFKAADMTLAVAGNILTGASIAGVAGSVIPRPADCAADGATGCVAGAAYPAARLANFVAGDIRSGIAVAGVAGDLEDCAADAATDCIANASYPATVVAGLASKVVSGSTVAGVSGNVTLPAEDDVLLGTSYGELGTEFSGAATLPDAGSVLLATVYGSGGTSHTGTLTLPLAANVVSGSATYGDPGAAVTPSYSISFPALLVRPAAPTITATSFNFGPERVTLTWSPVAAATGYIVLMRAGSAVTWTPTDGVTYPTGSYGSDTMIYSGAGTTVTYNTSVTAGTTYYFAIYSHQANTVYSYTPTTKTLFSCAGLSGGAWVAVPGDAAYGTNAFCVQKYAASDVSDLPTSQTGTTPWVSISQTAAKAACSSLGAGYHLLTNPEWMTIAANIANTGSNWSGGSVGSGTLSRGHSDNSPGSACAADASDAKAWVETNCTGQTQGAYPFNQRRTQTLSTGDVLWDIGGNVWQWLDYNNASDKPSSINNWVEYSALGSGSTTTPRAHLVPENSAQAWWSDSWDSTQSIGQIFPGLNGSGGALLRGASWAYGPYVGLFAAAMSDAASLESTNIGFRCGWAP